LRLSDRRQLRPIIYAGDKRTLGYTLAHIKGQKNDATWHS
jgi:hypothetical protein